MAPPVWVNNLISYSLQIAIVAVAGTVLAWLFRLRLPRVALAYWQVLLLVCLFVFTLQEWRHPVYLAASAATAELSIVPVPSVPIAISKPAFHFQFQWIGWILAGGALLRFLWLGLGCWRLRSFRRNSRTLPEQPALFNAMQSATRVRASIFFSDGINTPVTFGIRKPVIILPSTFNEMSEEWQKAVLCHELLHIRRRDWLFIILEEAARSVFWFHPAIWWLLGKIRLSREQAVDYDVVRLAGNRQPYLDSLLEFARARGRPKAVPAPLFLRERHLVQRVALLLKETSMSRSRLFVSLAAISILLIGAVQLAAGWFPLTGETVTVQSPAASVAPTALPQSVATAKPALASPPEPKGPQAKPARAKTKPIAMAANVAPSSPEVAPVPEQVPPPGFGSEPIRVGGNVQESKLIRKVEPVYPELAKRARIQGTVVMTVTTDKEGGVSDIKINSGHPLLNEAAVTAVRQWRYSPTLLNGMPVPVMFTVTCIFNLMGGDDFTQMNMDESGNLTGFPPTTDIESTITKAAQGGFVSIKIAPNTPIRVAEGAIQSLQQRGVKTILLSGPYTLYQGKLFYSSRTTSSPQFVFDFERLNALLDASGWSEGGKPKMLRYALFVNEVGEIVGVQKQAGPDNPEIDRELMRTRVVAPAMLNGDPIPFMYFFTMN